MLSRSLLAVAVLCFSIHAEQHVQPRQTADEITPVVDPTPNASGKPTTPTITVTAVVTSIATETNFVTVNNNVTIELTETETDLQTTSVTELVTNFVTNLVTDIETEVITNIRTLPLTEVVTQKVTLPAVTLHETQTVTKPALTVTTTKTVTAPMPPPPAPLCPGGNEEIFEASRGIYIIVCGQSKPTFDLIPGGQTTDSVYACAELCDSLTAAGVQCSAGIFEAGSSLCFPQGVDESSLTATEGFDTAVLNNTLAARGMSEAKLRRSSWLF